MFTATPHEAADVEDTLTRLLNEGRRNLRSHEARDERLKEQQAASAARSLVAAQRAMARFEWRPRSSVALINRCICGNCHSQTLAFAGFGVGMFRNSDQTERIVTTPVLDPAWPRETRYLDSVTPACMKCVELQGFQLEEPPDA